MPAPTLNPQMAIILDRMKAAELPSYATMSAPDARAEQERRNAYWNENPLEIARVEEFTVAGPFGARRMRLYDNAPSTATRPALLYLHGGGWVIGSIDSHDVIARELARRSDCIVAAYDYSLAPEHPFPQPLEDCIAGFDWLIENGRKLGIDADRIAVGGDSAGGGLTLGLAMHQRDTGGVKPSSLVLIYPTASARLDRESFSRFGGGEYVLSMELMHWFWNHHAPDPAQRADTRIELVDAVLNGLPPIYMAIAEFDPLRDEGDLLLDRLKETDTPVEYHIWRGVTHACLPMIRDLDPCDTFFQQIADFLRRCHSRR